MASRKKGYLGAKIEGGRTSRAPEGLEQGVIR